MSFHHSLLLSGLASYLSAAKIRALVWYLLSMWLSLTVHEFAHAWSAYKLGDDTAEREGRLTLSPFPHLDPIGSVLLPLAAIVMTGHGSFGWARPVPVNPVRFGRKVTMRTGMAIVAAAGPLSNLALAFLSLGTLSVLVNFHLIPPQRGFGWEFGLRFLNIMAEVNLTLCILNFLPIPPLDGSRLLPRSLDELKERIAPSSMLLLSLIYFWGPARHYLIYKPAQYLGQAIEFIVRLD